MKNIAIALCKAKLAFASIIKDRTNSHFKNKYASLDSVLDSITPALCENGLVLTQPTEVVEGVTYLKTILIHSSGETLESSIALPSVTDPQKLGGILTYYRRYGVCGLLAITADEDSDGNGTASNSNGTASNSNGGYKVQPANPSQQRVEKFKALIAQRGFSDEVAKDLVLNNFNSRITEMSDADFDKLIAIVKHHEN
jgi:hypothetical protein